MTVEPLPDGSPYKSLVRGACGCPVFKSTVPPDGDFSDLVHQIRGHEENCRVAT